MAIAATCHACNTTFRVKDEYAGKRGACPLCKAPIEIQAPTAGGTTAAPARKATAAPTPELLMQEILDSFKGEIRPVKRTAGYAIGAALLAVVMLVLPAIYVALIAAIAYLLFLHATTNVGPGSPVRGVWSLFILYVGPLVAGAILLFFMVKPVFARRARSAPLRAVAFGEESLLFALVTRIAKAVGAPEPKQIVLDCRANAGAGYSSRLNALLGRDLVLTVGLPLVGGLTVQQLAGVIAHELGHFSQGAGMRLGFVVRSVNGWFARVVYERDDWDDRLVAGAEKEDRMALLLLVAMLCIWVTRRLLWILMMIGHGLSCFMSRRMEYDADRYETRLAGSDSFAESTRRLIRLGFAAEGAFAFADGCWNKTGQLPDDLAALVVALCDRLPPADASRIESAVLGSKTGLFDTHPSHGDRIESARREKAPGIFHLSGPAAQLFKDFPKTSRAVTLSFYRRLLGTKVSVNALVPSETLLSGGGPRVNPLER